jgi:hypothetical protein
MDIRIQFAQDIKQAMRDEDSVFLSDIVDRLARQPKYRWLDETVVRQALKQVKCPIPALMRLQDGVYKARKGIRRTELIEALEKVAA